MQRHKSDHFGLGLIAFFAILIASGGFQAQVSPRAFMNLENSSPCDEI